MNDLQRLFKARGISIQVLADALDLDYHSVQKNVKGVRKNRNIQEPIAAHLGLNVEQCFGPRSARSLRLLIECEINKKRTEYGNKLEAKFLVSPTISARRKAVNG